MALRKRTNAYWNKRALERLNLSEKTSEAYRRRIASVYNKAQKVALADLKKIYANYWTKEGGFDKQKLNLITAPGDMKKFVASLKKAGLYDQIPKKYLGRISRLEYLNAQMWYQAHAAGQAQDKLLTASNKKIYNDSYYHSVFDVSKGIGMTTTFATLDKQTVDKVLETKFSGKNYSERIWTNSDILASQLQDKLAVAIANGQSIDKTARDIRERFFVSRYNAERLIRTETNYFHNSAELESYKQMGFDKFQFLATLDNRTSEVCAKLDGKIFDVNKGVVGYNVPPIHVNCRSTITPYFKDFNPDESEMRIYRDPETGENKYIGAKTTYEEWRTGLDKNQYDFLNIINESRKKRTGLYNIKTEDFAGDSLYKYDNLGSQKAPKNLYDKIFDRKSVGELDRRLTRAEHECVLKLKRHGHEVKLVEEKPGRAATNDFYINGKQYELKTPTGNGMNIIRNTIFKATDAGKRNLLLDCTYLERDMSWIISKTLDHFNISNHSKLLDELIIMRGEKIIRIK